MRVALVEPVGKGGLMHYAFQLARAMQSLGAEVILVTDREHELASLEHAFEIVNELRLWDSKPAAPSKGSLGRRAVRAAIWYREWVRLAGILRRLRADVVQFGDIRFATDFFPLLAIRRIAPLMTDICHNVRPFTAGSFTASPLYHRIYALFDAIFVHYEVNVQKFAGAFPEGSSKVVRIVHGNEGIFHELDRGGVRAPGAPTVLFFGTLSRYKGLDLLLDAFAEVARKSAARLVIAGFPHDFDAGAYRARAAELAIADRVEIVARYIDASEVASWMNAADVVVFPYRDVFQSGALHVAQTFGRPIVTTSAGAMAEVIRDRESGLVVEPDDPRALAAAIVELLTDRPLAARLGARAAQDASTSHSWTAVAQTMLDTYRRLR